jgi:hypothetical protein
MRIPLSMQTTRRASWFDEWFGDQMDGIFAPLVFRDGRFGLRETLGHRSERLYWVLGAAWTLAIGIPVFLVTESQRQPLGVALVRAGDYLFILLSLYVCLRYVLMTTRMVFDYSRLELKPMLSQMNDDGLRSFGRLVTLNVALACGAFSAYFIPAGIAHTSPSRIDLGILAVILLIVLVWAAGMPLAIYRAARESKSKAIHDYSQHLEKAFREFLLRPDEQTLARYEWLKARQAVIRRIASWPLSWPQNVFVFVIANLVFLGVSAWFVYARGMLSDISMSLPMMPPLR